VVQLRGISRREIPPSPGSLSRAANAGKEAIISSQAAVSARHSRHGVPVYQGELEADSGDEYAERRLREGKRAGLRFPRGRRSRLSTSVRVGRHPIAHPERAVGSQSGFSSHSR
jgi:hypothetical protein